MKMYYLVVSMESFLGPAQTLVKGQPNLHLDDLQR